MDLSGVNYELAVDSGVAGIRHRAERQIGQIAGVNITVRLSSSNRTRLALQKQKADIRRCPLVLALPIFPGRLQPSIVGRSELNFRVRDGNGWTLALISTNYIATAFAVTTIIFTFPLSVKRKMVTRTGFEPMLKA